MLSVIALSLDQFAGIREARVDGPLEALQRLPGVSCLWGSGNITIPEGIPAGVVILHRLFVEPPLWSGLQKLVAKGWLIISDIDDDPKAWKEFEENDYLAYRGVHAVTVSTEPLAQLISKFNPNVFVLPNAVKGLIAAPPNVPKTPGVLRIFFGALNRKSDWQPLIANINSSMNQLMSKGYPLQVVVVHDRDFYDAISLAVPKEFYETLAHENYLQILSSCDIALLPLLETPFNKLKSDLKFIECCAAGVVPICSEIVYSLEPEHLNIGVFTAPDQWGKVLLDLCPNSHEIARRRLAGLQYVNSKRLHLHQAPKRIELYKSLIQSLEKLETERIKRLQNFID